MHGRTRGDFQVEQHRVAAVPLVFVLPALVLACSGSSGPPADTVPTMPVTEHARADLQMLRNTRVFFAHQSVGGNIIDGLATLAREAGVDVPIAPEGASPPGPGVIHAAAGENKHPDSKIAFLATAIDELADNPPRVALLKLCYVDFNPQTDSEALFATYRDTITSLQRKFPAVTFVHATAPLTTRPRGMKDTVKRLLGRGVWEDDANARRAAYNQRIRDTFKNEPIFDLARLESTRPDGSAEGFTGREGGMTPTLFPGYTSDDGHLNAVGRRLAAIELARVLATATRDRNPSQP